MISTSTEIPVEHRPAVRLIASILGAPVTVTVIDGETHVRRICGEQEVAAVNTLREA